MGGGFKNPFRQHRQNFFVIINNPAFFFMYLVFFIPHDAHCDFLIILSIFVKVYKPAIGWLVVWGFCDSTSVCIGPSPRERERKEK